VSQWSKAWFLDWRSALLGYGLVGVVALLALRRRGFLSRREDRLLVFWAAVAFLLAKHELFTNHAVEPLHFTRGYIWSPLFLLGVPVLGPFLERLLRKRTIVSGGAFVLVLVVYLSDNAVWLTAVGRGYLIEHVRIEPEQKRILQVLEGPACEGRVVMTPDGEIAALVPVYTPLRVVTTLRKYTDEDVVRRDQTRKFFFEGKVPGEWMEYRAVVVFDRRPPGRGDSLCAVALRNLGGIQRELYVDSRYRVVLVDESPR
jgi:hypothetical protein